MGTDIHAIIEKRQVDGTWKIVNTTLDLWRCYDVFSILADVRNGYGFAGCVTGKGFIPISEPKGLPKDTEYLESRALRNGSYPWLGDHSFSWLTLRELKEYDYDQETIKSGVISESHYVEWKVNGGGSPDGFCGGVSGWSHRTVLPEELDRILSGDQPREIVDPMNSNLHREVAVKLKSTEVNYSVQVEWSIKYREVAHQILNQIIPALESVCDGDPDSVRLVFGFDS